MSWIRKLDRLSRHVKLLECEFAQQCNSGLKSRAIGLLTSSLWAPSTKNKGNERAANNAEQKGLKCKQSLMKDIQIEVTFHLEIEALAP